MRQNRVFKAAVVLLFVSMIAFFYRPIGFALLLVLGRNPACTFDEAVRGFYGKHAQLEMIEQHVQESVRLIRRDPEGYDLWETPRGNLWVPADSDSMLTWLITVMERKVYGEGDNGVQAGDVVLDCGAHIGLFSREALSAGADLVVAIEPAPENLECLRRNLADDIDAGRVVIYEKGVWDKEEVLTLRSVPGFSAADTFVMKPGGARDVQELPLTTIDRLVEDLGLDQVDFVKMNIEGAEQRALAGAQRTLSRFKPRMAVSMIHFPDDLEKIPQLVRQAQPDYQLKCGACYVDNDRLLILPEVMHFF
jgi:FkbM family methyltransferase